MSVGSTTWTPGRGERSAASVVDARRSPDPRMWILRALLAVALSVGAWALLAAWPDRADADEVGVPPCADTLSPTCASPPAPAGEPPVAVPSLPSDPGAQEPLVLLVVPLAEDPVQVPVETPAPLGYDVAPPQPDPAGTPENTPATVTPPRDRDPASGAPVDPPPPATDRADSADLAPVHGIPVASEHVDAASVDSPFAIGTTLAGDPAAVQTVPLQIAPLPCRDPELLPVAAPDTPVTPRSISADDPTVPLSGESASTGTDTVRPVPSVPAATVERPADAPTGTPTPAHLPVPLLPPAPVGPAGCPTSASSSACCHGAAQTEHADGSDAVLRARVTASLAQAAARPTAGFDALVVGGSAEPRVRPG